MIHFFETQGDVGDSTRVFLNLMQLAEDEGTLKVTEDEKGEINVSGLITIKGGPIVV